MSVSPSQRYRILKRDSFTCQYCGKSGCELEVDHVIAQSRGGTDDDGNLKTACFDCNRGKSDDDAPKLPVCGLYVLTKEYAGKVLQELPDAWRVELYDAISLIMLARFDESGEVKDIPKAEARVFNDHGAFVMELGRLMNARAKAELVTYRTIR